MPQLQKLQSQTGLSDVAKRVITRQLAREAAQRVATTPYIPPEIAKRQEILKPRKKGIFDYLDITKVPVLGQLAEKIFPQEEIKGDPLTLQRAAQKAKERGDIESAKELQRLAIERTTFAAMGATSPLKAVTAKEAATLSANAAKLTRKDLLDITAGRMKDKVKLDAYKTLSSYPELKPRLSAIAKNEKVSLGDKVVNYVKDLFKGAPEEKSAAEAKPLLGKPAGIPKEFKPLAQEAQAPLIETKPLQKPLELPPEGQKLKRFPQTVQRSEQTTQELKEAVGDIEPFYTPITNKESLAQAEAVIKESPDIARTRILSDEPVSAEKSALAVRLIKKYESEKNLDAAIEILDSYDKQLREAGRFIQAASLWNKLSPEGMLRVAEREARKAGVELPTHIKDILAKRMTEIQKMAEGAGKDKATLEVMNTIAEQLPPTKMDLFDAYRYQNMLSNPRSHERNIYGNLFQTLITRPSDLFAEATYDLIRHPFNPVARDAKFLDIPKYYQQVFTSIPQAFAAFQEGLRQGKISEKILETGVGKAETAIEALRREKLPKALTFIPRLMEATDRFFSVLIGTGEKARLLSRGKNETDATAQARELAEKYLFRSKIAHDPKEPLFVQALDSLGKLTLQGRRLPVIGKPWGWFVPFVTTPINIAKAMVRRSPFGFIGGAYDKEQMAQAAFGSLVAGIGALLALQDRTSWLPPTDPKGKTAFYDSGRKPFTVRVGDKWVPMWYFGPYALALALPASLKHFYTETRTSPTDSDIEKIIQGIGGMSRFIVSQTPTTGISTFIQAIEGDIDYSLPGQVAFTAQQIVPFQGMVRYLTTILDPIYRKGRGFMDAIKKDLPIISKSVPPYEDSEGNPVERDTINYFLPYDIGLHEMAGEELYRERIERLQELEEGRGEVSLDHIFGISKSTSELDKIFGL